MSILSRRRFSFLSSLGGLRFSDGQTMKRTKSSLYLAFLTLASCGRDAVDPAVGAIEQIVVTPAISTVAMGSSIGLSAQVLDGTGNLLSDRPVHWASEDTEIATVGADGMVTALKVGSVQIAASTGGLSGIAQVTVTTTPVASVHVSPGNKSLFVEQTFQFAAETRDAGGAILAGRPIAWSSNNESVATVSPTGLVTALSPGGAIITATSEGRSAPASVTVAAIPVASMRVQPASQSLVQGQTAQLQAQPLDADGKPLVGRVVLWSTSNASVATVTSTGSVTAHALGTAVITATCEGKTGSTTVTVNAPTPNAVIVTPAQVLVQEGATSQLTVEVLDAAGRPLPNSLVTYSSSNTAVASVSASGLITAGVPGKTTVSATSGGKTGTAEVTVTSTPVDSVAVTPSTPFIVVGRTTTLTAQALGPSGQVLTGRTITWSSSTPAIAEVSSSGVVTARAQGSTIVFASIDGVLGWANVTVVPVPVATVTVAPATNNVAIGETKQLSATLKDASGNTLTGRVVTWTSSQASVATVTTAGVVTGVSAGTTVISATSEGKVGTASVVVAAPGVRTVTVTPNAATIPPLGNVQLTATVRDPSGAIITTSITWTSSNGLIASVSSSGKVTAGIFAGTVTITAKSGSATGTATITVQ